MTTNRKLPSTLARKSAFGGAGETRYASSTWLRNSRAQVWFSATTAANRNATQINPPAISLDSSAVGLKAKLKMTTTSSEKNNMELMASLERHSMRRSFQRVARVTVSELTGHLRLRYSRTPCFASSPGERQSDQPTCAQTHPPPLPSAGLGASRRILSCPGRERDPVLLPSRVRNGHLRWRTAHRAASAPDREAQLGKEKAAAAFPASTVPRGARDRDRVRPCALHRCMHGRLASRTSPRSTADSPCRSTRRRAGEHVPCNRSGGPRRERVRRPAGSRNPGWAASGRRSPAIRCSCRPRCRRR